MADSPPNRRNQGKSDNAFRTISEVAGELDVPQHVLRFWETKFPQVKPMKRGGGRRYYRPEDIALLRRIRSLLYDDGYTIKGVQKLLRQGDVAPMTREEAAAARAAAGGGNAGAEEGGQGGGLPPETRKELAAVLGELESIRDSLREAGAAQ